MVLYHLGVLFRAQTNHRGWGVRKGLGQPARKDKSWVQGKKAAEKAGVGHKLLSHSSKDPDASQLNGQKLKMLENGLGFHYPCLFLLKVLSASLLYLLPFPSSNLDLHLSPAPRGPTIPQAFKCTALFSHITVIQMQWRAVSPNSNALYGWPHLHHVALPSGFFKVQFPSLSIIGISSVESVASPNPFKGYKVSSQQWPGSNGDEHVGTIVRCQRIWGLGQKTVISWQ